jgi:Tol biopolymer transport system component
MRVAGVLLIALSLSLSASATTTAPKTTLLSWGLAHKPANNDSGLATLSRDGRYVAFQSAASNLRRSHKEGLFIRDRKLGRTVGLPTRGGWAPAISANGRYVAFCTTLPLARGDKKRAYDPRYEHDYDTYVYDRRSHRFTWASPGMQGRNPDDWSCVIPGYTDSVDISADGRRVVYLSEASNLVPGDRKETWDLFLRDLKLRRTTRVGIGPQERRLTAGPGAFSISPNGRFVLFCGGVTSLGLTDSTLLVRDLEHGTTTVASTTEEGRPLSRGGCINHPPTSEDARYVAFVTTSPEIVGNLENAQRPHDPVAQLFLKDRKTGQLRLVTPGLDGKGANGALFVPSMSADGRYLVFSSEGSNLVPGDRVGTADVFLYDRVRRTTRRLNVLPNGDASPWDGGSGGATISDDGRYVVFASGDPNLVPGALPQWRPANAIFHVFIRGPLH